MPFCEIREVPVLFDLFTYCQNWHTRTPDPIGPIYASGLYEESYSRIPWHGNIEPEHTYKGVCSECGSGFGEGLQIAVVESAARQFCCNLHYLQWWTREHPGEDASMSQDIWQH